jgi:alkanesulfonate monooxygenase SsuD/methylene tetrahydromethanopterin reductase-like flavin-dependent oxidoreductase (luciferase family)
MTTPRKRPLKVGLFLPFAEGMMDGATARWEDLKGMAQCAEAVGFDSIWLGDHLLFRFAEAIPWANGATVRFWMVDRVSTVKPTCHSGA